MPVEQKMMLLNMPSQAHGRTTPEQYTRRYENFEGNGWDLALSTKTTLVVWHTKNSQDLNRAYDAGKRHPGLAMIIASPGNMYAETAKLYGFGSMPMPWSLEDFLSAEARAYELAKKFGKTG